MWMLKHKSVSLMTYPVRRFDSPEAVMTNFSAIICSTAKAGNLLDQHRNFVRCHVDSKLLTPAPTVFP